MLNDAIKDWTSSEYQRLIDARPYQKDLMWALHDVDLIVHHTGIRQTYTDLPFDTPGALFYAHWDAIRHKKGIYGHLSAASLEQARVADAVLKSAYHGTSLKARSGIAADGEIADAVNITNGKRGKYCEHESRKHFANAFSTLSRRRNSSTDPCIYGALLKLAVTRGGANSSSVNSQWRQQRGQFYIEGVWFHVLPIGLAFQTGYLDIFLLLPSVLKQLDEFGRQGHEAATSPPSECLA